MTGNFCDGGILAAYDRCFASERVPADYGHSPGMRTPLCTYCETLYGFCRFCRGVHSCTPPARLTHWSGVPQNESRLFNEEAAAMAIAREAHGRQVAQELTQAVPKAKAGAATSPTTTPTTSTTTTTTTTTQSQDAHVAAPVDPQRQDEDTTSVAKPDKVVELWNVHAPASKKYPYDAEARSQVCELLQKKDSPRVIWGGDFNQSLVALDIEATVESQEKEKRECGALKQYNSSA